MWSCIPTRPGITAEPRFSITVAPAGTTVVAASPMAWIRPPETTMVWSAFAGAPVPSITRTCVSAKTGASTVTNARAAGESGGDWAARPAASTDTNPAISSLFISWVGGGPDAPVRSLLQLSVSHSVSHLSTFRADGRPRSPIIRLELGPVDMKKR